MASHNVARVFLPLSGGSDRVFLLSLAIRAVPFRVGLNALRHWECMPRALATFAKACLASFAPRRPRSHAAPKSFRPTGWFMANDFDGRSDVFPDVYQLANGLPLRHAPVIGQLIDRNLDRVQQFFVCGCHSGARDISGTLSPAASQR
jgi:hypothetical protein